MVTHVVTLANSIVGVSVLAMPFCFKYCGVFLASLMLILSAMMTRIVCYFLLKSGVMTKRRSYEMLAYHTFGYGGKFMVEVTIIGFLVGTLIAFLVVIGDLGPQIVAEIFSIENNHSLRTVVMTGLALFVALPLGLLRDIDSLGSVSTISFLFYLFLVLKILNEGLGSLESERIESLNYWRPSGVLQCIPIFAMALSCQTQIFSIYDSLPDPSVQKMNEVVKKAVYLCTAFYFCVGFFGYLAFSTEGITGNILMSFGPTWTTQLIKVCFVLSIAFSVPLCIFPCRASLYSLFFRGTHTHHSLHDISTNYIPDGKLRLLTVLIVGTTLIIALLIPNIELVLGLVGSTAGSVICLIFPSAMFIRVNDKKTTERLLAQFLLAAGICIMVLTTYVTLYAVEQSQVKQPEEAKVIDPRINPADEVILGPGKALEGPPPLLPKDDDIVKFERKKEPPLVPKDSEPAKTQVGDLESKVPAAIPNQQEQPVVDKAVKTGAAVSTSPVAAPKVPDTIPKEPEPIKNEDPIDSKLEAHKYEAHPSVASVQVGGHPPEAEHAPKDAEKKEPLHPEVEVPQVPHEEKAVEKSKDDKTKEFLDKLEHHQKEQQRLIDAQKDILAQLAKHQQDDIHQHGEHEAEEGKIIQKLQEATDAEKKNGETMGKLVADLTSAAKDGKADVAVPQPSSNSSAAILDKNVTVAEKVAEKEKHGPVNGVHEDEVMKQRNVPKHAEAAPPQQEHQDPERTAEDKKVKDTKAVDPVPHSSEVVADAQHPHEPVHDNVPSVPVKGHIPKADMK